MSDTKFQTAATGTLTVHYRSGAHACFYDVSGEGFIRLCDIIASARPPQTPPFSSLTGIFMRTGRAIILNMTEVASIDFNPNTFSDAEIRARLSAAQGRPLWDSDVSFTPYPHEAAS